MATVTDDFNRADAATLGWEEQSTSLNWGIFTNEAGPRSDFATYTYHPTAMETDGHYVQATVRALVASTFHGIVLGGGPLGTSAGTQGGAYVLFISGANQDSLTIRRKEANATTLVTLSSATRAMAAGDVLRLERDADGAMRVYVNGSQITALAVTDTTFTGTGHRRAGLTSSTTGVTAVRYDDFAAGDLTAPTPPQILRPDADLDVADWGTAPLFSKVNDQSDTTVISATASGGTLGSSATTALRPNATVSNGWTLTGAATAHEALDEATQPTAPSTAGDHVSTSTAGAICEVAAADHTVPAGATVTETRLWVYLGAGAKRGHRVSLRHGTTVLATADFPTQTGWQSVTSTAALTQAQVNDLRGHLECYSTAGGGNFGTITAYAAYVDLTTSVPATPGSTGTARLSLASGGEPDTRTLHKLRVRGRKTLSGDSGTLRLRLYEGATARSAEYETGAVTTALADYTLALTDTEAAAIVSYADLEVRPRGYASGGHATVFEIAEISLETPASSSTGTTFTATLTAAQGQAATAGRLPRAVRTGQQAQTAARLRDARATRSAAQPQAVTTTRSAATTRSTTQPQAASTTASRVLMSLLSVQQVQASSSVSRISRALAAVQPQLATRGVSAALARSAQQPQSAVLARTSQVRRILAAAQAQAAARLGAILAAHSASQPQSSNLGTSRASLRTLLAQQVQAAMLTSLRAAGRTLAASQPQTPSVGRAPVVSRRAAQSQTASRTAAPRASRTAAQAQAGTRAAVAIITRRATQSQAASLAVARGVLERALAAAQAQVSALARRVIAARGAQQAQAAALAKAVFLGRSASQSQVVTRAIALHTGRAATQPQAATVSRPLARAWLTAQPQSSSLTTAGMGKIALTLSAAQPATAVLVRHTGGAWTAGQTQNATAVVIYARAHAIPVVGRVARGRPGRSIADSPGAPTRTAVRSVAGSPGRPV